MDFFDLEKPQNLQLGKGKILIAEPMLGDPTFSRTVILLCEHNEDGSVGFVLNKLVELSIGDLLPELSTSSFQVFQGGPVQMDTLHMLHCLPEAFGGREILPGIYWGGSYEMLQEVINHDGFDSKDLRLFLGYSGWSGGQLENELKEGAWIVTDAKKEILFETDITQIWNRSIQTLGSKYAYLANLPINPQMN